jgi:F420H(2)-dependent quinone reductase
MRLDLGAGFRPMGLIAGGLRPWFGVTPEVDAVVVSKVREARAAAARRRRAWLPPRWFVVLFWHGHRALVRVTRGRLGLWRPKPDGWGALRLTTAGRRTGRPRQVVVGYVQDGRNLVTMAMNGWGAAEPAWWLNLQARPAEQPHITRAGQVHGLVQADTRGRHGLTEADAPALRCWDWLASRAWPPPGW